MKMIEQIVLTVVTTMIGYFAGRRKTNADTDNQVLKNLELSVGIYTKIIDDLKSEIHELNVKVQDLQKMVDELMVENRKLKNSNSI
jgi:peptidoglycan hydrolase CwlO-like protein